MNQAKKTEAINRLATNNVHIFQQLINTAKGVYIINGKKAVVKP